MGLRVGRNALKILRNKPIRKKQPQKKPWFRWEETITIDLKQIGVSVRNYFNSEYGLCWITLWMMH